MLTLIPGVMASNQKTTSGGSSLQDVEPTTNFDLDATILDSYDGSSQTWSNLVSSPFEGASQTDYDLFLGPDGSATTADPTFTGTAGDSSAYFLLDGGDYFKAKTTGTQYNKVHREDYGPFWFCFVLSAVNASGYQTWMDNRDNSGNGFTFDITVKERMDWTVQNDLTYFGLNGAVLNGATHVYLISFDDPGGNGKVRLWRDGVLEREWDYGSGAPTQQGTTDAPQLFALGALSNGNTKMWNGTQIKAFSGGQGSMDNTKASAIKAEYDTRHGVTY